MDDVDGKRTERIEVYVSSELELALRRLAEAEDRKLSYYIKRVLLAHVLSVNESARVEQMKLSPRVTTLHPVAPFDDQERMA